MPQCGNGRSCQSCWATAWADWWRHALPRPACGLAMLLPLVLAGVPAQPAQASSPQGGLEVISIAKSYDKRAVLTDISLSVGKGEVLGLLGYYSSVAMGIMAAFGCLGALIALVKFHSMLGALVCMVPVLALAQRAFISATRKRRD